MDPFLFVLLLSIGVAVGWAIGRALGTSPREQPLFLVLGGMGALLGGALPQLAVEVSLRPTALLTAGGAIAILLLVVFRLGKGRLAG